MAVLLEAKGLSRWYGEKQALNGCSFTLEPGVIAGVLGPNGAGKSTLLKLMAGVLRPDAGEVLLSGAPVRRRDRPRIAYMADHTLFAPDMKTGRAMDYYAHLFPNFDRRRAEEIYYPMDARIGELSKGEAEQFDLSLLLGRDAEVYLLDEPLGGVDPVARAAILRRVMERVDGRRSVVMATHLVHDIEPVLDEVLFLNAGKVIAQGSAEGLREKFGHSVEEHYMAVYGGGERG